jgi:hypothetical protein
MERNLAASNKEYNARGTTNYNIGPANPQSGAPYTTRMGPFSGNPVGPLASSINMTPTPLNPNYTPNPPIVGALPPQPRYLNLLQQSMAPQPILPLNPNYQPSPMIGGTP